MTASFGIICNLIYTCLIIISITPFVISEFRKFSLIDSIRYTDIIKQDFYTSRIQCTIKCELFDGCKSVNHNDDLEMCELTARLPSLLQSSVTNESNWKIYYSDHLVRAIDAWQSTTFKNSTGHYLMAAYATDGNHERNGYECSHTSLGYSYWAMEFENVENVSHILVFFRIDISNNKRNEELRFLISSTRNDSDNNEGTECAYYKGPPASPSLPVLINCTNPVRGKFLRIIQNKNEFLVLCEVEVYKI